jgi:lipopolysaccharide export system permease protein
MKTYIKFLLSLYCSSLVKIFFLFFIIILTSNILEEVEFFKDMNINFLYPILLSFLNTPSVIFQIFPFIFLISTQFFFIKLIDSNELQIFKYSGLTNHKIVKIISSFTFFLGVIIIVFYYSLSSLLKAEYLKIKNTYTKDNKYLAVINGNGLWIKDTIDDKINIINANKINDKFLNEVIIMQFNKKFELIRTIESQSINIKSVQWDLQNLSIFEDNTSKKLDQMYLRTNFDLEKINNLFSNLSSLNLLNLIELRKNYKFLNYSLTEIDSHFNKIISYPIYLTLITILTSIIMLNIRFQKNSLYRVILGIFLSVIIYYITSFFNVLGVSEKIPLVLSVWLPIIILLILNVIFSVRLNEK